MTWHKRGFDLLCALIIGAFLAGPFLLLLAFLLVRQGRPIFHTSERMKAPDRPFMLWKLRTMTVAQGDGGVSGGDKAARITLIGRILRKFRADEIPQLWNVLRGDMSFVGPRPPLREYVQRFPDLYAAVLRSRPGITGLASLVYFRHEERILAKCNSAEETDSAYARRCIPYKAKIDLIYQIHTNPCLDMAIMAKTILKAARILP